MEIVLSVLVVFQFLFILIFSYLFFNLFCKHKKINKQVKNTYKVLCAIGNDTSANFNKVFSYIEHELQKEQQQDKEFPGSQL